MDILQIAAGALTGFVVGMTGVGGGALMTPLLVLTFGAAPLTAVGTDLWFAAITKTAISGLHFRRRLIDWPIVIRLWIGSLPASAATIVWMGSRPPDVPNLAFIRTAIGAAVCLTAIGLLADRVMRAARIQQPTSAASQAISSGSTIATVICGVLLGFLVTLTSVGAGALGAIALLRLYQSRLTTPRLVATDIAHAIPLAFVAGIGHLGISHVDGALLRDLLVGSIPAALAGAALSSRVPHAALRVILGVVLLAVGVRLIVR